MHAGLQPIKFFAYFYAQNLWKVFLYLCDL